MRYISALISVFWATATVAVSTEYPVDDSYTVSQRFEKYQADHPELVLPELTLEAGQRIAFDRHYHTADGRELHTDIFLPAADKAIDQAVMLIHGGGWRSGNKSHFYALANLLAQKGYVVFTPEYRLSMEAPYPAGLIDINHAIAYAKSQADALGFDATKLAIGGGSSGGHMAALIGNTAHTPLFRTKALGNTAVNAVIDLDGVLDFTHPLAIANENKRKDKSAAGMWFGGAMETTREKWVEASTAKHIHPQSPPMLIISSGQMRFTAGKDEVLEKLGNYDIANQYFQYDTIIHTFWLFDPYLTETANRIHQFLSQHAQGVQK